MEDQPGGGKKRKGTEQNGHMCWGKPSPDFKDNGVKREEWEEEEGFTTLQLTPFLYTWYSVIKYNPHWKWTLQICTCTKTFSVVGGSYTWCYV